MLKDDSRGAGHITMISAMLMGRPQIITQAEVVQDYLELGRHAVGVPFNQPEAAAQAMRWVLEHSEQARHQARAAQRLALERYTNAAIGQSFLHLMKTLNVLKS